LGAVVVVVGAVEVVIGAVVVVLALYRKVSAEEVADVPLGPVTVISTVPGAPMGDWADMVPSDKTLNVAELVPKSTAVAPVKLLPLIVTVVPPAVEPVAGDTAETAGAAALKIHAPG
jgi:hypothetical protein